MTWAAWRVQRPQLLAAMGAVVLLGLWLAATGLAMGHSQSWKYWTDGDVYVLYALPGLVGLAPGVPQAKSNGELARCAVQAHVHYVIQFQPDSHYWPLQGAETAIFAILAAALIGVTVTAVRRWTA